MKRKFIFFFVGILTVALLSGCSNPDTDTPVNGESTASQEETKMKVPPAPAMDDTILANKKAWKDNTNLYDIPLEALSGVTMSDLYRFGNDLLLVYTQFDEATQTGACFIKLCSIETGEVLYEQQLGALVFGDIQILDGYIAVNDLGDGKCYLLDETLALVATYELPNGTFCLNQAADTAYQFTYNEGVRKVDLATGEKTVLLDNGASVYMCEASSTDVTFIYTDRDTLLRNCGVLDLKTGEITLIDSPYAYSRLEVGGMRKKQDGDLSEPIWIGKVESTEPLYVLSNGEDQGQFYADLSATVTVNHASNQVVICEEPSLGNVTLSAYDETGRMISTCQGTDLANFLTYDYAWFEEYGGYLFTLMDGNSQEHLLFWDLSGDASTTLENQDLALENLDQVLAVPKGSAVSREYYEWAQAISKKYDVEVLIADQCDTVYVDHRGELLLDEAQIDVALSTLEQVLAMYPDGFFSQLPHDTYKKIQIQIMGTLEKDYSTEEMIYISGGFVAYSYPGKLLMALDARGIMEDGFNGILAETIYHEVSHIIDRRLDYDSQLREDAAYTEAGWLNLNPEGFEYNDTYYGTMDSEYADYFVDAYACTNSTEDRAQIMQHAMDGDSYMFELRDGLRAKLEYYCNGIRESFDTTDWPEETPWEKTLHQAQ